MWVFEGREIVYHEDLHPSCTNIVYEITYTDGRKYIGKKCVRSIRRLKPTKKQLTIRKNYVRKEVKDLPFKNYKGSSKLVVGLTTKTKEILYQCSNKKAATYIEAALLFKYDVLFNDQYLNENISGTFYDSSLEGLINFED